MISISCCNVTNCLFLLYFVHTFWIKIFFLFPCKSLWQFYADTVFLFSSTTFRPITLSSPLLSRVSASQEGYEDVQWNSSSDSHPPWLRFHLGISRWQLYPHRDPNAEALTQQLATQRVVSAGVTRSTWRMFSTGRSVALCLVPPKYGAQSRQQQRRHNGCVSQLRC